MIAVATGEVSLGLLFAVIVILVFLQSWRALLVPATTGEVTEYGSLPDRNVSTDVMKAITDWLQKNFAKTPR